MTHVLKYYWDACVWIDLINQSDDDRFRRCSHVLSEIQEKRATLSTSAFTIAEVYKRKCDGKSVSLPEEQDDLFESFYKSGSVRIIALSVRIAEISRRLCRDYSELRKPQDAVHVASCIARNIDELHTFDVKDLIRLDGQIRLRNGNTLRIRKPPSPPKNSQLDLFDKE